MIVHQRALLTRARMLLSLSLVSIFLSSFTFAQQQQQKQQKLQQGQQQSLVDVPAALFEDGLWRVNVNYVSADSVKMYNEYKLAAACTTHLEFQEIYCLGKSIEVIITDDNDPSSVKTLAVNSTVPYNCTLNVQDPDQAALMPQYAHGHVFVPAGNYSIKMRMQEGNTTDILGYRGFAVRASVPVETLALASKCRHDLHQNGPIFDKK